jgi:hypothetical protein
MDKKCSGIYYGRVTSSGVDVIGRMSDDGLLLMDIFMVKDMPTHTGLNPVLLPMRSMVFLYDVNKRRKKFNMKIEKLSAVTPAEDVALFTEGLSDHMINSYETICKENMLRVTSGVKG